MEIHGIFFSHPVCQTIRTNLFDSRTKFFPNEHKIVLYIYHDQSVQKFTIYYYRNLPFPSWNYGARGNRRRVKQVDRNMSSPTIQTCHDRIRFLMQYVGSTMKKMLNCNSKIPKFSWALFYILIRCAGRRLCEKQRVVHISVVQIVFYIYISVEAFL